MLDADFIEKIPGAELDRLLSEGWYRMGLSVFTSDFIDFNEQYYRTIWLRYDLRAPIFGKTWRKLLARNKHFRLVFSEASNTEEQDHLFGIYRNSVAFEQAHTIE
ncbi:MAG: arginyl-tRNA--protein arginylyltransferase, partial [Chitinophagaceae bacterium]|nr:arginyl-tRNA--protein arginylyltransferase [Chitinophagaceae bacterium]